MDIDKDNGWICLHRSITKWEWYEEVNVKVVFLHFLLKANHRDKKWKGLVIKRGSLITSLKNLSKDLRLTVDQIRTAIKKLKNTNEITHKSTNKYTFIQVRNYDLYQDNPTQNPTQNPKQIPNKSQTNPKQIPTNNNNNNENNENNKKKNIKKKKDFDLNFIDGSFKEIINIWLEYKKDRRESYKNQKSIRVMYSRLLKLSDNNIETAIKIVEQSIANNWAGLFELKGGVHSNNNGEEYIKKEGDIYAKRKGGKGFGVNKSELACSLASKKEFDRIGD